MTTDFEAAWKEQMERVMALKASAQSSTARVRELEQENHTLAQRLLVVAGTGKKMLISYGEMEKQNSVLRERLELMKWSLTTPNVTIDNATIVKLIEEALEAAAPSEKGEK